MFLKDTDAEIHDDLTNTKQARKQVVDFLNNLEALAKHESAYDDLQDVIKHAKEASSAAKVESAGKVATCLVFANRSGQFPEEAGSAPTSDRGVQGQRKGRERQEE